MPSVYLSPSTQQSNLYVIGGTEEYYMNLVADAMEPYLEASGISFGRNTPDMTAASSIRQGNAGGYDLYLAIHSNASPEGMYGELMGTDVFYYPTSRNGKRFAEIIAENFKSIYPYPELVDIRATTALGEVRQPTMPSVLVEVAYHDNEEDADWIVDNINPIARELARSVAEYFGVPFVEPVGNEVGVVNITSGSLNIRSAPSVTAPIIARAGAGERLLIIGEDGDWYRVNYGNKTGFANKRYVVKYS
ncbi:MAG: N-acetylmuramoyl-L-alanine amidase [Clostridia bacterium]|nr:N-acetylmuramoyl-L-alanine amidase [Clostridia bacterium]MBQ2965217.1 N-acetylmuramoyl-L-alanine amidase [Clostridia bacterium]MBQ6930947.1 N-acetylmuramoyl-L-alanine amidase [Clostridia bacterium]